MYVNHNYSFTNYFKILLNYNLLIYLNFHLLFYLLIYCW